MSIPTPFSISKLSNTIVPIVSKTALKKRKRNNLKADDYEPELRPRSVEIRSKKFFEDKTIEN